MQTHAIASDEPSNAIQNAIQTDEKIRFKNQLASQGMTMTQFAAERDIDYMSLCRVVRGYNKGRYGMGFKAVVAVRAFLNQS